MIRPLLVATTQRLPCRAMDSTRPMPGTVCPRETPITPPGPSRRAVPLSTSRIFHCRKTGGSRRTSAEAGDGDTFGVTAGAERWTGGATGTAESDAETCSGRAVVTEGTAARCSRSATRSPSRESLEASSVWVCSIERRRRATSPPRSRAKRSEDARTSSSLVLSVGAMLSIACAV